MAVPLLITFEGWPQKSSSYSRFFSFHLLNMGVLFEEFLMLDILIVLLLHYVFQAIVFIQEEHF